MGFTQDQVADVSRKLADSASKAVLERLGLGFVPVEDLADAVRMLDDLYARMGGATPGKTCPKCGQHGSVRWHAALPEKDGNGCSLPPYCVCDLTFNSTPYARSHDEHLHCFCSCGYDWIVPCLDSQPRTPALSGEHIPVPNRPSV